MSPVSASFYEPLRATRAHLGRIRFHRFVDTCCPRFRASVASTFEIASVALIISRLSDRRDRESALTFFFSFRHLKHAIGFLGHVFLESFKPFSEVFDGADPPLELDATAGAEGEEEGGKARFGLEEL